MPTARELIARMHADLEREAEAKRRRLQEATAHTNAWPKANHH